MKCKGSRKVLLDDSVDGTAWINLSCVLLAHEGRCMHRVNKNVVIFFDKEAVESEGSDSAGAR